MLKKKLLKYTGKIECKEAVRLITKLKDECADFSRQSQSRTFENISFRALVIAYLKACVLYVANDCKWERANDAFIKWSLNYDIWCKIMFFGEAIEVAESDLGTRKKYSVQNLLTALPETFSEQEAVVARQANGMREDGVKAMLRVWKNRGYIKALGGDRWKKA